MIRKLGVLLLCAVAWTAAPPATRADSDSEAGIKFYEKAATTVLKAAGAKIWGAADDARKVGLYALTKEQAERALEFDPNLEEARDYLGFVKKEGKWVADPEATAKVPFQNTKPTTRSDEAQAQLEKKWTDESLKTANRYCAKLYADLGDTCAAKGFADQAVKGYEAALRLDKGCEKARKGLGYTKFGSAWITKKQDDARKAASKAEVLTEAAPTAWETLFGTKLNKIQSKHFRFESQYDVAELTIYATACETAYAYYLADFGRDPTSDVLGGNRILNVVCKDDVQWNQLVDKHGGKNKEFTRTLAGVALGDLGHGVRSDKGSSVDSRRDLILHQAVHELGRILWNVRTRAWLDEGLAYYYTLKVLESCLCFCVAQKQGDYSDGMKKEGGLKDWGNPDSWKPLLKEQVQKKNDTALRSLTTLPITKLEFEASVKCWGVVTWLMETDRDKFVSILTQLKEPDVKQEAIVQGTFSMGYEDLDSRWHQYVLRAF